MRNSPEQKGFTLIEIIIATTILGLALVAVLQVFALGINSTRRSQKMTIAVSVAQNIMEEVISRDHIEDEFERGVVDDYGLEYSIDIQAGELEGTHEVEVAVMWSDSPENKAFQLFCLVPEEASGFSVFPR